MAHPKVTERADMATDKPTPNIDLYLRDPAAWIQEYILGHDSPIQLSEHQREILNRVNEFHVRDFSIEHPRTIAEHGDFFERAWRAAHPESQWIKITRPLNVHADRIFIDEAKNVPDSFFQRFVSGDFK